MLKFVNYIFQDYFSENDFFKQKAKCVLKALVWPSVPSAKVCVWVRLSMYFSIKKMKYLKQHFQYKVYKKFNCSISGDARIGKGLFLPHPQNVIIGKGAIIGQNATIYHGVTIGQPTVDQEVFPRIGDNVIIYCNSTIVGDISLGDNIVVGAQSLVINNVPSGETVVGCPAKVL